MREEQGQQEAQIPQFQKLLRAGRYRSPDSDVARRARCRPVRYDDDTEQLLGSREEGSPGDLQGSFRTSPLPCTNSKSAGVASVEGAAA